ncbi:MAG: acetate--CoA ligase family protein [Woeseiaceae bacterium]|nr:acetate--CoA ligase family protein [Woeseiaceae bacterium]
MKHRLDPLLRPQSVAIVGASARTDSVGDWILRNLQRGGYRGRIYPVNPNYDELQCQRCYAALHDLPETPDLVAFAVSDARIEAALDEAIAAGIPAAVIQSTLALDDDPHLRERIQQKLQSAGMLVCGANGMGYYNVRDHVWTCGFDSASHHKAPGNVALISHSGSGGMSGLIDCDERLRVNLAVSTGNELTVTMDEYLDFVLDLPETRAVGLFIETARNPAGFRAALEKAAHRGIPIVALKVGRTARSAELAISHSGAMAGDDATYEALFDRYGVQRARDQDEFATMLILFAELYPVGAGSLVSLHDSGGERQLFVDLADEASVPLTDLSDETVSALEDVLDPELPAINPLDGWSRGGPNAGENMSRCLSLMMQDEQAALGAVVHDRGPGGEIYPGYLAYMQRARSESGKPVALVAARQGTGHDRAVVTSTHAGYPIIDGVGQFLAGVRALFAYRDFRLRAAPSQRAPEATTIDRWRGMLIGGNTLSEADALAMLGDFGVPASVAVSVDSADLAATAASRLGYPVALKTAKEGVVHKSDVGGVVLDIGDEAQLRQEYDQMSERLGDKMIVSSMAPPGVEMFLGLKHDPQFGPVVLIGAGGVLAETINDVQFALPPFDAHHARRCVDRLKLRPLLDGVRGQPAVDVGAFCEAAARFSEMATALGELLAVVDVNPVVVHATGATAVDALVVGRDRREAHAET